MCACVHMHGCTYSGWFLWCQIGPPGSWPKFARALRNQYYCYSTIVNCDSAVCRDWKTVCFEVSPLHFRNEILLKVFVYDWIIWYGIYIGTIINAAFKQKATLLWPGMTCHIVRLPIISQHSSNKIENVSGFQTQAM